MSPSRGSNDRNAPRPGGRPYGKFAPHPGGPRGRDKPAGAFEWLWGRHAVEAALANPLREDWSRLLLAPGKTLGKAPHESKAEIIESREISRLLPAGAVHQGYALLAKPLEPASIDDIGSPAEGVILMLDQVTDPQNVGTILRSAAAFGAKGVILQERHAPQLSGVLAKAAAGAVDLVPVARTVNLSRALERLSELGWRNIGLEGGAAQTLDQVLDRTATVLVLGSEGEGLRRLVAEHCDTVAKIAAAERFESLNVASAAAVALYEASRLAPRGN